MRDDRTTQALRKLVMMEHMLTDDDSPATVSVRQRELLLSLIREAQKHLLNV